MTTNEMFAQIITKLEEQHALLRSMIEPSAPSSSPSTSVLTADTEAISSPTVSSPTSAPPPDADPGFPSPVTALSSTRDLPVITNGAATPPPLLSISDLSFRTDITNGPAKQASASALRSVDYGRTDQIGDLYTARGLPFAHLVGKLEDRASLKVDAAAKFLVDHEPSVHTSARAWRPPWLHASRSSPSRRRCSSSQDSSAYIVGLALAPMPALTLDIIIRPYDPGARFVGGARVGIYFDVEEAEHAPTFAMGLIHCSARTPADLRTGVGTTLDAVYIVFDPGAVHLGRLTHALALVPAFKFLVKPYLPERKAAPYIFAVQRGARVLHNTDARNAVLTLMLEMELAKVPTRCSKQILNTKSSSSLWYTSPFTLAGNLPTPLAALSTMPDRTGAKETVSSTMPMYITIYSSAYSVNVVMSSSAFEKHDVQKACEGLLAQDTFHVAILGDSIQIWACTWPSSSGYAALLLLMTLQSVVTPGLSFWWIQIATILLVIAVDSSWCQPYALRQLDSVQSDFRTHFEISELHSNIGNSSSMSAIKSTWRGFLLGSMEMQLSCGNWEPYFQWDGNEKSVQTPLLLKSPWPPPTQDASSGIDQWSVYWPSIECSNVAGFLLQQPWSPSAIQLHKCMFVPDHTMQWQPYMTPPVQFQKASRGTNLQMLPCLCIVCTGAEAKQSKFLLVLLSGICYAELPIVHSNFQSYILLSEVLSERPVELFICRNDSKFLLQQWPPPDSFLFIDNPSDQFISFSGVTREAVVVTECAWQSTIFVLQCLISAIVQPYPGTLLCFVDNNLLWLVHGVVQLLCISPAGSYKFSYSCYRGCRNGLGTSHVFTGGECQEQPPCPPPVVICLFGARVTEEISFTIYPSEMADQQLQYTDGVLSTGWKIQKMLQECGTAQSKQSFKSENQIFLDMLEGYSFAQSVLRGRQCFQYFVQLPSGCLSTWGMLKIQGQYDIDARTPSWTRLKHDQIIAGNGTKQLELNLHTVPDQSFLWNLFSITVALREARHEITIDIDCSMLHVASASQSLVAWDPGIFEVLQICNISTHGLGSSRSSRREVCHQPSVKGSCG